DRRALKRRNLKFEPVTAGNSAASVDKNNFSDPGGLHPWKHETNGRFLKHIDNPCALFRSPEHDSPDAVVPLQVGVRSFGQRRPGLRLMLDKNGDAPRR